MSLKQERDDKAQWSVTPTVTRAFVFYIFLFQMYRRVFLYEEGCEGWTIMDFSDQLCFRKLLTVLHRFLKTLFIMKSTKTIFAISSIRCIKPLNSSSSCSPEQVYFSKKQKNKKISKKKKNKRFLSNVMMQKKRKKGKKKKEKKTSILWVCTKTMKTYSSAWPDSCGFVHFVFRLCFFPLYEMGFLTFK